MAAIFSLAMAMRRRMASNIQILAGDIGGDGQRHRLLGEARGFQLLIGGAQIVPRQAPEIQFIAGIEIEAERLPLRNCWQLWPLQPPCWCVGLPADLRETEPRAGSWIALRPASPAPRRWRCRDCRPAPAVDQRGQLRIAKALPPGWLRARLWRRSATGPVNVLGTICGGRACGTGVAQPASSKASKRYVASIASYS